MSDAPVLDRNDFDPGFWAAYDEECALIADSWNREQCYWDLVSVWPFEPDLTEADLFRSPAPAAQPVVALPRTVLQSNPLQHPPVGPLGRRFLDALFFFAVGVGCWLIYKMSPSNPPTSIENVLTLLLGFVIGCGVGSVPLMMIIRPMHGMLAPSKWYNPYTRWLGWLWSWWRRPVDSEWAQIDAYSGSVYADYLRSPQWNQRREIMLRKADHRCQLCNSKVRLQVHHRTYDRIFKERPEDLVVLCRYCHAKFHHIR